MNSINIFEKLSQIFKQEKINNELFNTLRVENASKLKTTLKIYILEFLLDKEDKNAGIKESNDIWFIKDNDENIELCYKYIELLINLLKYDKLSEINIFNEIDVFINTKVGNKVFYLISILNKFLLHEQIILLFVGFALGEKKEFIRNNFIANLQYLLSLAKSKKTSIDNKMNIYSLKENILETLNVYFMFLLKIKKDFNSINSLEEFLFNSVSDEINLNNYYEIIAKAGKIKYLYSNKKNNIKSILYKMKESKFIEKINENIKTTIIEVNLFNIDIKGGEEEEEEEEEEDEDEEVKNKSLDSQDKQIILFSNKDKPKNEIMSISNSNQQCQHNKNINITCKGEKNKEIEEKEEKARKVNQKNIEIDKNIEANTFNEKSQNFVNNKIKDTIENSFDKQMNKINQNENKRNKTINNGEEKNLLSNNIIYTENNDEKETNSNSSLISQKSKATEDILKDIMKYVDYPKYSEFNFGTNINNDANDFYAGANTIYFLNELNQKVNGLKNMLKNSIFDIKEFVEISELESKIRLSSLTNLKLEILINILKNPNIVNIKRKIIEIITFHLMLENVDYFQLKDDFEPDQSNLDNLEKMIDLKLLKKKNDKKILNDSERFRKLKLNIKSKISENKASKDKLIYLDKDKKKKLFIAKNFLDYYKSILNNPIHITGDNSNYYLLPRSLFNSEIEVNKYLYDLESVLSENDSINTIIGLNVEKEIVNFELYKKEKLLDIKDILKILFSFNSQFKNIDNQATKIIKNKRDEFLNNIKKKAENYKNIFIIDEKNDDNEKCNVFDENINTLIDECVNKFENEVLNKFYELIEKVYDGEINKEKENIICKVRNFVSKYIENCHIKLIKKEQFPDIVEEIY